MTAYDNFPADARIWIYQSNKALNATQIEDATTALEQFVKQWLSHGKKVKAWAKLLRQHFIVFMVDENYEAPSGCSIDSSVALVKELEQKFKVDFFDRMTFTYLNTEKVVVAATRDTFASLYHQGQINDNTIVFNNLVTTKSTFETAWKVPLKDSWHINMV